MSSISKGNCYLCGTNLGKAAMKKHIFELHEEDKDGQECCLLKIEGAYNKNYWLYIDVPMDKTLKDVDVFLRKIWLECCGHLSEFFVHGPVQDFDRSGRYLINPAQKLKTFSAGEKFFHMYDFGSTTDTAITVMGNIRRKPQRNIVRLLARNTPPVFKCEDCGEIAFYICITCIEPFEHLFYCMECGIKNEDEEHIMLPITNSPRMGVCGYTGEYDTFEFSPASKSDKKRCNMKETNNEKHKNYR